MGGLAAGETGLLDTSGLLGVSGLNGNVGLEGGFMGRVFFEADVGLSLSAGAGLLV